MPSFEAGAAARAAAPRGSRLRARRARRARPGPKARGGPEFDEADPIWRDVTVNEPSAGRLATRVAVIRSMRIRGRSAEAEQAAVELVAAYAYPPDDDVFHDVEAARLELARVQLATDDQQAARATAGTVLRHYREGYSKLCDRDR